MKTSVLLVTGRNPRFVAEATAAARAAFPGGSILEVDSVGDALATEGGTQPEILVLASADEATAREAVDAVDGQKLPRWAVVAGGEFGSLPFAEVVTESEWNASVLARSLKSAVALHLLRRDVARLKGDLLSVGIRVAHDLRTPIGGIMAAAEVIEGEAPGEATPEKALTQPIIESANDLGRIVGQLTLLAKAVARPAALQVFNMGSAAGRALERVEMRVRERRATVSKPASWPDVRGDPEHAEAIWVGLIDNALRHSGASPRVELGWEAIGEGTRFWVRDAGPGIVAEKRRFLFQPFHRRHEPSAARGLGLGIIERLVSLQAGNCGFEPVSPTGSLFYFWLPR
ncbi:MAG TPA: HAMP domain-containing sensor histidine kinase [Opitutaceae bacterium]